MKKYATKGLVALAAAAALFALCSRMEQLAEENDRLRRNQDQLLQPVGVEFTTTADGHSAAEVEALNLKVSELKAANDSLLRTTRSLGIRNRRLMELAQAATGTQADVTARVSDSIVHLPGRTDTLPCMAYADAWLSFSGCIRADTFSGTIRCRDTLDIAVHRVPRRFLFLRFGTKAVRLDAVSHNPHTTLTHARYIRISR